MLKPDRIYCMDCLQGLPKLDADSVDIIITSPPYNIGKKYLSYNDVRPRNEYLDWLEQVAQDCRRLLKKDGSFFLNVGGKPTDPWVAFDIANRFRRHYHLQNTIHWIKSIAIPKKDVGGYSAITNDIAVGHYQPVNSLRYLSNCHEYIFQFTKTGKVPLDQLAIGVKYQDKTNIGRWKKASQDLRGRGNTWFIPYPTIQNARSHPTTFPVQLPEMCIKLHGYTSESLVLDPFMGTGSTAHACNKLGIHFIGFEIDSTYVVIATAALSKQKKKRNKTSS